MTEAAYAPVPAGTSRTSDSTHPEGRDHGTDVLQESWTYAHVIPSIACIAKRAERVGFHRVLISVLHADHASRRAQQLNGDAWNHVTGVEGYMLDCYMQILLITCSTTLTWSPRDPCPLRVHRRE